MRELPGASRQKLPGVRASMSRHLRWVHKSAWTRKRIQSTPDKINLHSLDIVLILVCSTIYYARNPLSVDPIPLRSQHMSKLLLTTLTVLVIGAAPAFAQKRSEYNFNTCSYNFYGQANPMNGQGAAGTPVNFYKGVGATGATTEKLRANMSANAAIYQQTPQRTRVIDNWGFNKNRRVSNFQQQALQAQQQPGYYYVPGQNTTQTSTQCSVTFDQNGAMQYTTNSGTSCSASKTGTNK